MLSNGYIYLPNTGVGNTGYAVGSFTSMNGVATINFLNTSQHITGNEVNTIIQGLLYSNTSLAPPAAVNLQYTFNDGYGVAGITTSYTTVNIAQVDHAPTITVPFQCI